MSDRSLPGIHGSAGGKGKLGCGAIAAIVVAAIAVVIVGLFVIAGLSGGGNEKAKAVAACEGEVKARLKAPSTARFSSGVSGSDGDYTVAGQVDAENSFGATVRSTYTCAVAVRGDAVAAKITDWQG